MTVDHWSDIAANFCTHMVSIVGIGISALLIYIMRISTNLKVDGYLVITRTVTFCNLVSLISTFMVTARLFYVDESPIYKFQGFCTKFSRLGFLPHSFCYYSYISELHMLLILQFLLIYCYIYRYLLLTKKVIKGVRVICYFLVLAVVVYYHFIFFFASGEIKRVVEITSSKTLNLSYVHSAMAHESFNPYYLSEKLNKILPFVVVIVAAVFNSKIDKKLNSCNWNPRCHRDLLNALNNQTIFLLSEIIAICICYLCKTLLGFEHPILENFIRIPMVSMSAVIPVLIFNSVKPYKKALLELVGFDDQNTVIPLSIIET